MMLVTYFHVLQQNKSKITEIFFRGTNPPKQEKHSSRTLMTFQSRYGTQGLTVCSLNSSAALRIFHRKILQSLYSPSKWVAIF